MYEGVQISAFQRALLDQTMAFASEKTKFYAQFVRDGHLRYEDLPIIDSRVMGGREADFGFLSRIPDAVLFTGGTTGVPGVLFRTDEEERATLFHSTGLRPGELAETDYERGISLQIAGAQHGFGITVSANLPVLKVPLQDVRHARAIAQLLRHGIFVEGRSVPVTKVVGSTVRVKVLSQVLESLGGRPEPGRLRQVVTHGSFLTDIWRQRLSEFFGAAVNTAYGLTELGPTAAIECPLCMGYHMSDMLVTEVVDAYTGEPLTSGCGIRLATTLYPFFTSTMRLRYDTGDLVTIVSDCPVAKPYECVLRLHGRMSQVPLVRRDGKVVPLIDLANLMEVLEGMPWTVVETPANALLRRGDRIDGQVLEPSGHIRANITATHESGRCSTGVRITAEAAQVLDPRDLEAKAQELRRSVLEKIPLLAEWTQEGNLLAVDVVPSNDLGARPLIG